MRWAVVAGRCGGHARGMELTGILSPDAPDPQRDLRARLRSVPTQIWGLAPQPAIAGHVDVGLAGGGGSFEVSLGYPLWRTPADHTDPSNLADLDARTRASLDAEPPWPRPAWLVETVERMRYRRLWEAVRTSGRVPPAEPLSLAEALIAHTRYILISQHAAALGIDVTAPGVWDHPGLRIPPSVVDVSATVVASGIGVPAARIDTDPFVYAVGFAPTPGIAVTAVIAREELPYLQIAFAPWDGADVGDGGDGAEG